MPRTERLQTTVRAAGHPVGPPNGFVLSLLTKIRSTTSIRYSWPNVSAISPPKKPTILVVDDQSNVRSAIAFFLETCGYDTFQAASGTEALDVVKSAAPDGVLMDVQMPRMDGIETCRRMAALGRETGRPAKTWLITGVHYPTLVDDCSQAGGLGVFYKPFDWPQLLDEIGKVLLPPVGESGPPPSEAG